MNKIIICQEGKDTQYQFQAMRCQMSSPTAKVPDMLILYSEYDLKSGKYNSKQVFDLSKVDYFFMLG